MSGAPVIKSPIKGLFGFGLNVFREGRVAEEVGWAVRRASTDRAKNNPEFGKFKRGALRGSTVDELNVVTDIVFGDEKFSETKILGSAPRFVCEGKL